jgi:hypothetical protein
LPIRPGVDPDNNNSASPERHFSSTGNMALTPRKDCAPALANSNAKLIADSPPRRTRKPDQRRQTRTTIMKKQRATCSDAGRMPASDILPFRHHRLRGLHSRVTVVLAGRCKAHRRADRLCQRPWPSLRGSTRFTFRMPLEGNGSLRPGQTTNGGTASSQ